MAQATQYLSPADEAEIANFLTHYAKRFFLIPDSPLYHYTTGENFIKIIQSGELWATQAACLNDATELIYAVEQLKQRVNAKMDAPHNKIIDPILTRLGEALSDPSAETSPVFVACFSERRDDLSQWRAYSGGEGGYAIQFEPMKLREAGFLPMPDDTTQPQILLVRVEYDPSNHATMFDDILVWTEKFFLGLEGARLPRSRRGLTSSAYTGFGTFRSLHRASRIRVFRTKGNGDSFTISAQMIRRACSSGSDS